MGQKPNKLVRFDGIELLESGEHTDGNSQETIYYDVERLEFAETVLVTLTSEDTPTATVGKVVPGSDEIVDSTLYVDIVIDTETSVGKFASKVLSGEKDVTFDDIGPEIQSEGQEITASEGETPVMNAGIIDRIILS